jgi:hypothetical protein
LEDAPTVHTAMMGAFFGFPYSSQPWGYIYAAPSFTTQACVYYVDLFLIHVSHAMDLPAPVADLETRLGFNFKNGLSKEHRAKNTKETQKLLEGIETLNDEHASLGITEIRKSQQIKREAEKLFNHLGPALWPADGPLPTWLLQPEQLAIDNDPRLNLYPKRLVYSRLEDRRM